MHHAKTNELPSGYVRRPHPPRRRPLSQYSCFYLISEKSQYAPQGTDRYPVGLTPWHRLGMEAVNYLIRNELAYSRDRAGAYVYHLIVADLV